MVVEWINYFHMVESYVVMKNGGNYFHMVFSYGGILCSNEKLKLWAVTWVNLINMLAKKIEKHRR